MKISRRNLILSAAAPLLAQKKGEAVTRPNVLLMVASDVPAGLIGCYGNKTVKTPGINLLARMGTRFTNSCACTPASSANRATLFTGLLPRQHGILDYLTPDPVADPPQGQSETPASFRNQTMLSDILAGAGYACGYVGVWDMGNDQQPGHGFTHTCTLDAAHGYTDPILYKNGQKSEEKGYSADVLTANGIEFLDKQTNAKPFFLTAAYWNARPPYDGQPQANVEAYAKEDFAPLPEDPVATNGLQGKEMLGDLLGNLRRIAAAISALDSQVTALTKHLETRKLWDNTLVIFTSDRGTLTGQHGLWGGGLASNPINMYEEALQVPQIWSWPGRVPVAGFRPELVSAYDFLPSVCEAVGVKLPEGKSYSGQSYANLAFGKGGNPRKPWRTALFAEYRNTEMARDARYKMIARDKGKGPGELYDLRADASEHVNQYENDDYVAVRRRLTADLESWHSQF